VRLLRRSSRITQSGAGPPTRLGDRLVATATEVARSARSGIYDVSVTLENAIVAEFRAQSRVIGGPLLSDVAAV